MKACIVIPTHPSKFNFAYEALKSYNENNIIGDLFFVFSSCEDYKIFKDNLKEKKTFLPIVLKNNIFFPQNIITFKKFYALEILFNHKYDYITVLDCDIKFLKFFKMYESFKNIYEKKEFKCNISKKGGELIKNNIFLMNLENNINLLNYNKNYNFYWWFNEICVYEREHTLEFFDWLLNHKNYNLIINNKFCFDYNLYSLWLIAFKNFKLNLLENNKEYEWSAIEHNFKSAETSNLYKSFADANRDNDKLEHIKILIHVDR
jgi:hypothetical protein